MWCSTSFHAISQRASNITPQSCGKATIRLWLTCLYSLKIWNKHTKCIHQALETKHYSTIMSPIRKGYASLKLNGVIIYISPLPQYPFKWCVQIFKNSLSCSINYIFLMSEASYCISVFWICDSYRIVYEWTGLWCVKLPWLQRNLDEETHNGSCVQ